MPKHDNTSTDNRWSVGDDALCINRKGWRAVNTGDRLDSQLPAPVFGKVYKVTGISFVKGKLHLKFAEFPPSWDARSFIKATPPEDLELDEEPLEPLVTETEQ